MITLGVRNEMLNAETVRVEPPGQSNSGYVSGPLTYNINLSCLYQMLPWTTHASITVSVPSIFRSCYRLRTRIIIYFVDIKSQTTQGGQIPATSENQTHPVNTAAHNATME
jgi:hypothetical protein